MALKYGQQYYAGFKPAQTGELNLYKGTEVAFKMFGAKKEKESSIQNYSGMGADRRIYGSVLPQLDKNIESIQNKLTNLYNDKPNNEAEIKVLENDLTQSMLYKDKILNTINQTANQEEIFWEKAKNISDNQLQGQGYLRQENTLNGGFYKSIYDNFDGIYTAQNKLDDIWNNHSVIMTGETPDYGLYTYKGDDLYTLIKDKNTQLSALYKDPMYFNNRTGYVGINQPFSVTNDDILLTWFTGDKETNKERINKFLDSAFNEMTPGQKKELMEKSYNTINSNISIFNANGNSIPSNNRIIQDSSELIKKSGLNSKQKEEALANNKELLNMEDEFYSKYIDLQNQYEILKLEGKNPKAIENVTNQINNLQNEYNHLANIQANRILADLTGQIKIEKTDISTRGTFRNISEEGSGSSDSNGILNPLQYAATNDIGNYANRTKVGIKYKPFFESSGIDITIPGYEWNIGDYTNYNVSEQTPWNLAFGFKGVINGNPVDVKDNTNLSRIFNIVSFDPVVSQGMGTIPDPKDPNKLIFEDPSKAILFSEDNLPIIHGAFKTAFARVDVQKLSEKYNAKDVYAILANEAYDIYERNSQLNNELKRKYEDNVKQRDFLKYEIDALTYKVGYKKGMKTTDKSVLINQYKDQLKQVESELEQGNPKTIFMKSVIDNTDLLFDIQKNPKTKIPESISLRNEKDISDQIGYTLKPYMNSTVKVYKEDLENLNEAERLYLYKTLGGDSYTAFSFGGGVAKFGGKTYEYKTDDKGNEYFIIPNFKVDLTTVNTQNWQHKATDVQQSKTIQKGMYDVYSNQGYDNIPITQGESLGLY